MSYQVYFCSDRQYIDFVEPIQHGEYKFIPASCMPELIMAFNSNLVSDKIAVNYNPVENTEDFIVELYLNDLTSFTDKSIYLYELDPKDFIPLNKGGIEQLISFQSASILSEQVIPSWLEYMSNSSSVVLNGFPTNLSEAAKVSTSFNMSKRKQAEELLYKVMSIMDESGQNTKKYKDFFSKMSNEKFKSYMTDFLKDPKKNFYLEIFPFVSEPTLGGIKKAADVLDIPLDEYMYMPFENPDGPVPRTQTPCMTGFIHGKVMQQVLSKKNTSSIDISKRNQKTGQVIGNDKNGRITDVDNFALTTLGADYALREYLGPRADDMLAKEKMTQDINMYGYTSQKNLPNDVLNKRALNTLNMYFLGAMLITDLIPLDELFNAGKEAKQYNRSNFE